MRKTKVVLNKPIFCGAAILDLSKIHMFNFHYNYVKKKWDKVQVLYTDTDSLVLEIETEDFFQDTAPDVEEWFDTSGIPKNHFAVKDGFPVGKNKKVLGKFKDEAGGKIIREFVGLRPKCYSIQIEESKSIKKAKGTKKNVTKSLTHQDFKDVLFGKVFPPLENVSLRSHFHEIFTETIRKVALSAEDDKRVVQKDGVATLALGHWRLGAQPSPSDVFAPDFWFFSFFSPFQNEVFNSGRRSRKTNLFHFQRSFNSNWNSLQSHFASSQIWAKVRSQSRQKSVLDSR